MHVHKHTLINTHIHIMCGDWRMRKKKNCQENQRELTGGERARNKEGRGYMKNRGYAWRTLNSVIMISAISLYCDCFLQSSYLIELAFTDTFISAIQVCLK